MNLEINQELKTLIPPLTSEEYFLLEQSLLAEGCRDALVIWKNTIVDGHNRYEICQKHSIEFKVISKEFVDIEEIKDWIDANQLGRRNLTEDQRQILIGRRYNREKKNIGGTGANQFGQIGSSCPTADKLAEDYKVSPRTVKNYGKTADLFEKLQEEDPELAKEIFEGKITLKEVKNKEKIKLIENSKIIRSLPEGTFEIIYCDPPWQYNFAETSNRQIENQYPTMKVEDICNMKLPIIADNALLLLWATAPKIIEALKVIEAWGFEYKTHCVWDKGKIGMGYWFRGQHELLLVATKGKFSPPNVENRNSSVYRENREGHSVKPEFYYNWIEKAFPNTNKIELFARNKRTNWGIWGNLLKKAKTNYFGIAFTKRLFLI